MLTEIEALAGAKRTIELADQKLVGRVSKALSIGRENLNIAFGNIYNQYVAEIYKRLSHLRTVLTKDQQVPFSSIYVNLWLGSEGQRLKDDDLLDVIRGAPRILVQGTGGAGKSMLMRYLALNNIESPNGKIPIFVELRSLDFSSAKPLNQILFDFISQSGSSENFRVFSRSLSEGLICVYLDGLDEVPSDQRNLAIAAIKSFCATNPRCGVVISTRPGNNPDTLSEFSHYKVLPLTLVQAVEVVRKTNADDELKEEFVQKLEGGLFDKHETFLGIPLLVAMMLLTYSNYSDIPDRMSVFYEQAFSTLYALHDTVSKGPYKRKHFAGLAPDNFSKCFETFCYVTLSKEKYDFLYAEIMESLRKSIEVSQVDTDAESFLKDLEESVCLMLREGIRYVFTHRSFQEYFAAKFALRYGGANQFKIIDNCIGREWQHNTVKMLHEIDDIKFRKVWVLPAVKEMKEMLVSSSSKKLTDRLREFFAGWHVTVPHSAMTPAAPAYGFFMNQPEREERLATLGVALSRVTNLVSPYDFFRPKSLLPSKMKEAREVADQFPGSAANKYYNMFFDTNSKEKPNSVAVMFDEKNSDWLVSRGIEKMLNEYVDHVSTVLREVEAKVQEQDELELSLF